MIGLWLNEWKKIRKNRFLWIFFCLFFFVNLYQILHTYEFYKQTSEEYQAGYEKLYSELKGSITKEKVQFIINKFNETKVEQGTELEYAGEKNKEGYTGYVLGDWALMSDFYDRMKYAYEYEQWSDQIVKKIEKNIDFFQGIGLNNQVQKNEMLKKHFADRKLQNLFVMDHWIYYIEYDFSSLLVILLIAFGTVSLVLEERQTEMEQLIDTTCIGRKRTKLAKLLAAFFNTCLLTVFFRGMDLILFAHLFGYEGWSQPIYSLEVWKMELYKMTMWQYVGMDVLLKLLGMMIFCAVCLVVVRYGKNVFVIYICIVAILIGFFACHIQGWDAITPFSLITNRNLIQNLSIISIFHKSYSALEWASIGNISVLLLFSILFCSNLNIKQVMNNFKRNRY